MYERNAIVIDRYFAGLFGYDQNSNIKINGKNYFELVEKLEEYQIASENENNVMAEFERIANQIKETQKLQEILEKRNLKYVDNRKNLFDNLDEDAELLNRKFDKAEEDINKNNEEIKSNTTKFIDEIREFHEKSEIRTNCGRERRKVESEYQKILNITTDNFEKTSKDKLKSIKAFAKADNKEEEKEEIRQKILKNGAKEKVPFDINVINKAIDVYTDIEEKKVEIYLSLYDKTNKLLDEIKNDSVKIEKHKKIVRDSQSKLEYLNMINEYMVLFLDNERMNTIGGEKEHENIMLEACDNAQNDLIEIQNMYSILLKEISDKATKKAYKELYNLQYLFDLQDGEKEFEKNISRLNVIGGVIYPEHWRIEGLQKIYETFRGLITNVYGKDLTEYEPLDITCDVNESLMNLEDEEDEKEIEEDETISEEQKEDEQSDDKVEALEEDNAENEEENQEEEEEFQWDDEDMDDELNFDNSGSKYEYDEEESIEIDDDEDIDEEDEENIEDDEVIEKEPEEISEEEKNEEEIDKILGFFDETDQDEDVEIDFDDEDSDDEEDEITFDDDFDDLDDFDIEENTDNDTIQQEISKEKDEEENKKSKKRKSFFGRNKK